MKIEELNKNADLNVFALGLCAAAVLATVMDGAYIWAFANLILAAWNVFVIFMIRGYHANS